MSTKRKLDCVPENQIDEATKKGRRSSSPRRTQGSQEEKNETQTDENQSTREDNQKLEENNIKSSIADTAPIQSTGRSNMVTDESGHVIDDNVGESGHVIGDTVDESGHVIGDTVGESGHVIDDTVNESGHVIDDTVGESGHVIGDTVAESGHVIDDTVGESGHVIGDTVNESGHVIGDTVDESGHVIDDTIGGVASHEGTRSSELLHRHTNESGDNTHTSESVCLSGEVYERWRATISAMNTTDAAFARHLLDLHDQHCENCRHRATRVLPEV